MSADPSKTKRSLHDLPQSERPRERLMTYGAKSLSTTELLAIILRTGTASENVLHMAERILAHFKGLQGIAQASQADLEQIPGLGAAKAMQIIATVELAHRFMTSPPDERPVVRTATDAARLVMDMSHLQQEHVRIILVDTGQRVIHISPIYIGTLNASILRTAEIFREAINRNSPGFILVHNHPSGNPDPSPEDIEFTRNLIAAGQLLDIQVIDHIIIGNPGWFSMREAKLAFK
ncbi:MAG: DNA repair protein RadC [Anaerolineae bacterium]|nr:DNA repair protein RadC [Anaerolineae bacterium]